MVANLLSLKAIFLSLLFPFAVYALIKSKPSKPLSFSLHRTMRHDSSCYTQGLLIHGDFIIESCGLYGRSSIRIIDQHNGTVLKERKLNSRYFAEGVAIVHNYIYVLTWTNREVIILEYPSLTIVGTKLFSTHKVMLSVPGFPFLLFSKREKDGV
jgi:glutaminyl-peptide cyclotransferase